MNIRPFAEPDLQHLIDLTIDAFRPFYEGYVHPLLGDVVFQHQHGQWEQDYRDEIPALHRPGAGRHVVVADAGDAIAGYVSWKTEEKPNHGQIYLLAVAAQYRPQHVGLQLCRHAIEKMSTDSVVVVEIGTGDDDFHAPARALYESLGFTKIPIAGYLKGI